MARERRSVARSMFTSKKIKKCADSEALLFVNLILEADDEGRGEGDAETVHMKAKNRRWSDKKIEQMMAHLSVTELVDWYTNNGAQFYEVVCFLDFQQGSWHGKSAKPSKYPDPRASDSVLHHDRLTGTPTLVDGSTIGGTEETKVPREVNGIEVKGKEDAREPEPGGNVENPECAQVHEGEGEPEIADPALRAAAARFVGNCIKPALSPQEIARVQDETAIERRRQ